MSRGEFRSTAGLHQSPRNWCRWYGKADDNVHRRGIEVRCGRRNAIRRTFHSPGRNASATVSGHAHREEDISPGAARIETSRRIEDETAAHALVRVARIVTGIAVHVRQAQRSLGRSIVVEHAERKLAVLLQRLEIRQFSDMHFLPPMVCGMLLKPSELRDLLVIRVCPGTAFQVPVSPELVGASRNGVVAWSANRSNWLLTASMGWSTLPYGRANPPRGRGGLVILIFQVECVPFGRSGHPDGGIALTHEDVVVARQVVIADQDDAAPALIFADRTGGLTGKADFGPGRSLHRAAQHAVELDPLLADLDLGLPGTFGKSPPRRRSALPARRRSDASAGQNMVNTLHRARQRERQKKISMLFVLKN